MVCKQSSKISLDVYDLYLVWKAYEGQEDVKVTIRWVGATSWESLSLDMAFPTPDLWESDICPLDSGPSLCGLS